MWIFWWTLSLVAGLIGLYLFVVIPAVLLYSSVFPQKCPTCQRRTLRYLKFVSKDPGRPESVEFIPRAYYECRRCRGTFKLERGDWLPVEKTEVEPWI